MDKSIQDAINKQIGLELYSAYVYLAMSAHFAEHNFDGFASWMRSQAQEEQGHAMRLFDYLLDRGAHVDLGAVKAPPEKFGSPLEIYEEALGHEQEVTRSIHELYALARDKKDFATEIELQWFITEQVEEEATAETAVEQLRLAGDNPSALLMLDHQFGQREG
jgi:ferritin